MTHNEFQALFQAVWDGDDTAAYALGDALVEHALEVPQGTSLLFALAESVVDNVQIMTVAECHFENDGQGNRKIRLDLRDQWGVWRTETLRSDNPGDDHFATMVATFLPRSTVWIRKHLVDSLKRDKQDD